MTKGFTLIELLVTLLIVSVALLGMSAIQVQNLKRINESEFQSLATLYAFEMAERMRANTVAVKAGFYDDISGEESKSDCSNQCTPEQLAIKDVMDWNQAIQSSVTDGGLPGESRGVVSALDMQEGFLISVQWQVGEETQQFNLEFNL